MFMHPKLFRDFRALGDLTFFENVLLKSQKSHIKVAVACKHILKGASSC